MMSVLGMPKRTLFAMMRRHVASLVVLALGVGVPATLAGAQEAEYLAPTAVLRVGAVSPEAASHFWAALDDAQNVFPERAARRLEQALSVEPDFGLARALWAFVRPGSPSAENEDEFKRAIASLAAGSTGELLVGLAWREWDKSNWKAARTLMAAASEFMPDDPRIAFEHALLTGIDGGVREGIEAMQSVTARFPQYPAAYNNLAYWLWQTGDRREAFESVRKYVELVRDHPNSHDSYAELLQWEGRYQEASEHYRRAIELDESYTEAYVGLAEVYHLSGRADDARAELIKARERSSLTVQRLNLLRAVANSYLMEGNTKRAVEHLEKVAAEAEANGVKWLAALANRQLAVIDGMAGKGGSIEARLAKAAEIEGDVPAQQAFAAMSYSSAGRMKEAWGALGKLEEAAPGQGGNLLDQARAIKAFLYLQENEPAKALDELAQADPQNDFVKVVLAECYTKLGRRADARAFRAEVLGNRQMSFFDANAVLARFRAQRI